MTPLAFGWTSWMPLSRTHTPRCVVGLRSCPRIVARLQARPRDRRVCSPGSCEEPLGHPPRPLPSPSKSRSTSRPSLRPLGPRADRPDRPPKASRLRGAIGTTRLARHSIRRGPKTSGCAPPSPETHSDIASSVPCTSLGVRHLAPRFWLLRPAVSSRSHTRPLPVGALTPGCLSLLPSASGCHPTSPVPPSWFIHLGGLLRVRGSKVLHSDARRGSSRFCPAHSAPSARPATRRSPHLVRAGDRSTSTFPSARFPATHYPSKSILADSRAASPRPLPSRRF